MARIPDQQDQLTRTGRPQDWLVLLVFLGLYALLILPTINRLGIGWDEATDLRISRAYLSPNGLFFGLSRDLSQTRLPMFAVALVFQLLGTSELFIARLTSVFVGGLTLLGIYIYGRDRFSHKTGLLAAGLLAINPFFLSFARLAFTESDVYLACTLTWLLVFLSRLEEKLTMGYAVLSGLFLGLSISSKATVLVIIPAVFIAFLLQYASPNKRAAGDAPEKGDSISARALWFWAGLAVVLLLAGVFVNKQLTAGGYPKAFQLVNYAVVWLGWLVTLGWAVRLRKSISHPVALFAYVTATGLLTFIILPPDHLTNSGIIEKLISRAEGEMIFSLAFIAELAALHLFTIFLKSTPVLGLGLLMGFAFSLVQWRRRALALPLLVVVTYLLAILLLPLAQTFYTIPILPILSLLAADQLMRLYTKRRILALTIIVLGLAWWGSEMKQMYPDYHLNGYQWLGARPFLGRSSIGYRSIVYVPSDGVQQTMEWLNTHAAPGQVAQLYVEPWHIVNSMATDTGYTISDGLEETLGTKPDYVVIHIGSSIWQGEGVDNPQGSIFRYPYDPAVLSREYEQVFVVRRAFDLEVASVWARK